GKTVTEGLFAVLTDFSLTTNPLAKNLCYARAYGFRGLVAPPGLVMNVVFSQSVEDVSENGRANLEYLDMRFGVPVYIGDTLEAETLVLGVKASSRDPDRGVVHVQTTGRNQDGQVVLTFQRKVQVWKRDLAAKVADGEEPPRDVPVTLALPDYDPKRDYRALAYLSNPDTYFEDFRARPDLGILDVVLRGHKFVRKGKDAPAERVDIFYLERELAVKRRSHYA